MQDGLILVTGAAGKVGQAFLRRYLALSASSRRHIRALCHNRTIAEREGLSTVRGDLSSRDDARKAMDGVSHVIHLATCKEIPDQIMDVAVKGLFWLLEEARSISTFRQFILLGGDAAIGHFFYKSPVPTTEQQRHTAYPGCYALSKVLEEVMLEQYYVQYDLNGCCLRAPWIMEKDDFRRTLSFGDDVFGGPRWRDLVGAAAADEYVRSGAVPVMLDGRGQPVKRNFVHVEDLVDAILAAIDHPSVRQQTLNIAMDEPVDYGELAAHLATSRGLPSVAVPTRFESTWLDNTKAKYLLGWRPRYDLKRLADASWNYVREADDPPVIWYPG